MTEINAVREKTVLEEIADLDIEPSVRNRILLKAEDLESEYRRLEDALLDCHLRIDLLERVIVELSIKRYGTSRRYVE